MAVAAPTVDIDLNNFKQDPYPTLAKMRAETPICFVPQLNAILFTRRDDIFNCEKNIEVFSSEQPNGLMTQLMGANMMRKDGDGLKQYHGRRNGLDVSSDDRWRGKLPRRPSD